MTKGVKMNTEELVNGLENVNLPGMELAYHRQQLKRTLLESHRLLPKPLPNKVRFHLLKPFIGLASRQPVWKTLVISSLTWIVVVFILAFVFFAPISNNGMTIAMATDLALNNAQIKAILPADGTTTVMINDIGNRNIEIFIQKHDVYINAEINSSGNLKIKKITYYSFLPPQQGRNSLTVEENEKAVKLATVDIRVRSLQNAGFTIQQIEAVYCNVVTNNIDTAKVTNVKQMFAFLILESGNEQQGFLINLETGLVLSR